MADEEKDGVQLKTSATFTWYQIRWGLVLFFCFISGGATVQNWMATHAIQRTADSAETAATTATSKVSEIDAIKKDLAQTKSELKQYKMALDSWNDFFADEESRQKGADARRRYREQRLRIREILKPISRADELYASPLFRREQIKGN